MLGYAYFNGTKTFFLLLIPIVVWDGVSRARIEEAECNGRISPQFELHFASQRIRMDHACISPIHESYVGIRFDHHLMLCGPPLFIDIYILQSKWLSVRIMHFSER